MWTFRDRLVTPENVGATAYGVSIDAPFPNECHGHHDPNFDLVSDTTRELIDRYDVRMDFAGLGVHGVAKRSVFEVDDDGEITYAWTGDYSGVEPDCGAVEEAAADATTGVTVDDWRAPSRRLIGRSTRRGGPTQVLFSLPLDPLAMSDIVDGGRSYDPTATHAFPDEKLNEVLPRLLDDPEVKAYLQAQNVNAVTRKGYNDHGPQHIRIVRNRALRLYELLKAGDCEFNGARDQGLDEADEAVIVALAATLHDIGHVVHRDNHAYYSIPLAADVLDRFLQQFYDLEDVVRVKAETLHAILCHHTEEDPLTREAGVIRVADALDMERGRSRIPYEKGGRGINTLSSQAISDVVLRPGDDAPVLVEIEMVNAAGVYQVDNLLKAKLDNSGLEGQIRIVAINTKKDDQLVERIEL